MFCGECCDLLNQSHVDRNLIIFKLLLLQCSNGIFSTFVYLRLPGRATVFFFLNFMFLKYFMQFSSHSTHWLWESIFILMALIIIYLLMIFISVFLIVTSLTMYRSIYELTDVQCECQVWYVLKWVFSYSLVPCSHQICSSSVFSTLITDIAIYQ